MPNVALSSVKLESCFVVKAFVPVSYHCLICSTAAKHSFTFQWLQERKTLHVALHWLLWKLSYIVSFDSYQATNWTKTDLRFCQMDLRVEVNGWSDGILVVLLGFDTCTVGLTYTTWFFVANNSLNLWLVTLIGENIACMHAGWEIRITPIKWLRLPLPLRSSTVGWECGCHANIAEHIMETFSPSF